MDTTKTIAITCPACKGTGLTKYDNNVVLICKECHGDKEIKTIIREELTKRVVDITPQPCIRNTLKFTLSPIVEILNPNHLLGDPYVKRRKSHTG